MGILRGIITLALMILFVLYAVWAWSNAPKKTFEAMSRLPLEDDDGTPGGPQP
ncbi:MAG: cbb3-type cytochrome c oxidase subunit 3 [Gammaproteobacteria bacterium]|nr:cbb3-type cytochrome c oxidase subunit 3 [Gammaproteobacteria bacterium]